MKNFRKGRKCCESPKFSDCCNHPKIQTKRSFHREICTKGADGKANNVDPDQTAPPLFALGYPKSFYEGLVEPPVVIIRISIIILLYVVHPVLQEPLFKALLKYSFHLKELHDIKTCASCSHVVNGLIILKCFK